MKKHFIFFIIIYLFAFTQLTFSDSNNIFNLGDTNLEGYTGPLFTFTKLNGKFATLGSGPISLIFNRSLSLGINVFWTDGSFDGLFMGYGGLQMEYIFFPKSLFHFSLGGFIGTGSLRYISSTDMTYRSPIIVIEPQITTIFNVSRYLHLSLGGSYRFAFNTKDVPDIGFSELSNFSGFFSLQYGVFHEQRSILKKNDHSSENTPIILTGTFSIKFSSINSQLVILDGGSTRALINNSLAVGIGGYRLINTVLMNNNTLKIIQIGLSIEYLFNSEDLINFSMGSLIGLQTSGYEVEATQNSYEDFSFLFVPGIYLNLNIIEFMKISIGASYRFVIGVNDLPGINMWDLSGPSFIAQIRAGLF